jgi:hypothetical protein
MAASPKNQRGIVLVTCLFLLLTLSVIGAAAIHTTVTDTKISGNVRGIKQSHFLAEAGISHSAEFLMDTLSNWESYKTSQALISKTSLGNGHYEVMIEDGGGDQRRRIVCTGTTNTGAKTRIEAILMPEVAAQGIPGLFGCEGVELDDSVTTQSYSSSGESTSGDKGDVGTSDSDSEVTLLSAVLVHGDVLAAGKVNLESDARILGSTYANGTISLLGNTSIGGDAETGDRCTGCSGQVGGSIEEYVSPPPVEVTPCDPLGVDAVFFDEAEPIATDNDNGELSSTYYDSSNDDFHAGSGDSCTLGTTGEQKQHYFSSFITDGDAQMTIQGDVSIYVNGDVSVLGHSDIDVPAGSKLTIYVTGEFFFDSNAQINNLGRPQDLMLYSNYPSLNTSDFRVKLHSSADLTAVVYAPRTAVEIRSSGNLFGAVRGKYVYVHSGANFWYDEDLTDLSAAPPTVRSFGMVLKRRMD